MDGPIAEASEKVPERTGEEREVLCFLLGEEEFAIDVMELKEIIKPREVLEVPETPPSVRGIIFLRGEVVPIVDLRVRLGLPQKEIDRHTRFVLAGTGDQERVGLVVDRVKQVSRIPERAIEAPLSVERGIDAGLVDGIGHLQGRLITILKLHEVLRIEGGRKDWKGNRKE